MLGFPPFLYLSLFLFADFAFLCSHTAAYNALHCWSRRFIVACFAYSFVYSGTIKVVKVIKTKQIMIWVFYIFVCLFVIWIKLRSSVKWPEAARQYCIRWWIPNWFGIGVFLSIQKNDVGFNGSLRGFDEMTDEMYACIYVWMWVCMFRQIFVLLGFSASKDGSVFNFFVFTSANLFQRFLLFYFQDLIYQSSLVRGNRKKTVQELFCLFLST